LRRSRSQPPTPITLGVAAIGLLLVALAIVL
jgi:hypothetical protein